MNKPILLNVHGKVVIASRSAAGWDLRYKGKDGKSRPANDLVVPDFIGEDEIIGYLSDLCHEWASEKFPVVVRIDQDT